MYFFFYIWIGNYVHELFRFLAIQKITLLDASKALQSASGGSGGKERETEWSERLAVHFFLPLSLAQDCVLDSSSNDKVLECPCSCKFPIMYGDTSIGKLIYNLVHTSLLFNVLLHKRAQSTLMQSLFLNQTILTYNTKYCILKSKNTVCTSTILI